jgi:magnesium transporter
MTVEEAILKIRQVGINRETIYTCYVLDKRKLIGVVSLKELLINGDTRTIEEIMETNLLYVHTHDDQEEAASMINRYGLIAIPVVDKEMRMVGIVTVDDAMEVIEEETTEDINMMVGIVAPCEET